MIVPFYVAMLQCDVRVLSPRSVISTAWGLSIIATMGPCPAVFYDYYNVFSVFYNESDDRIPEARGRKRMDFCKFANQTSGKSSSFFPRLDAACGIRVKVRD